MLIISFHFEKKYRDGEARIVEKSSSTSWECELYALLILLHHHLTPFFRLLKIDPMEFDSLQQQEQQNLQGDGTLNQEILSPSNIEDSC